MSTATLALHNPKFESRLTSYDAIRALPEPVALGPMHKPVPHHVLIDAIRLEAETRQLTIRREAFAIGANGGALFAVFDFAGTASSTDGSRGTSLGLRNSTDTSLAIQGVAGTNVFVCDNLSMRGQTFAFQRKNTTRLDLHDAIASGFDRFTVQVQALNIEIERLSNTPLDNDAAKLAIYDAFTRGVCPVRLLDDVHRFYFNASDAMTDCYDRTAWALQNAFTRAMRDLTPMRRFSATVALGRYFEGL